MSASSSLAVKVSSTSVTIRCCLLPNRSPATAFLTATCICTTVTPSRAARDWNHSGLSDPDTRNRSSVIGLFVALPTPPPPGLSAPASDKIALRTSSSARRLSKNWREGVRPLRSLSTVSGIAGAISPVSVTSSSAGADNWASLIWLMCSVSIDIKSSDALTGACIGSAIPALASASARILGFSTRLLIKPSPVPTPSAAAMTSSTSPSVFITYSAAARPASTGVTLAAFCLVRSANASRPVASHFLYASDSILSVCIRRILPSSSLNVVVYVPSAFCTVFSMPGSRPGTSRSASDSRPAASSWAAISFCILVRREDTSVSVPVSELSAPATPPRGPAAIPIPVASPTPSNVDCSGLIACVAILANNAAEPSSIPSCVVSPT